MLDTGSRDDTMAIATRAGAHVEQCAWPGSFSDARNTSLDYATGEWILVVDADEIIAPRDHAAIRKLLTAPPQVMGYILIQHNYTSDQTTAQWQPSDGDCPEARGVPGWFPAPITRLFRRDARIRFVGEVHEAVDPSILANGGRILETAIPIHHYGKLRTDERMAAKAEMYRALGEQKSARSGSALAHYELGLQYGELGLLDKAEAALRKAVAADPNLVKGWADLGAVLERLGRMDDAERLYRRALALDPAYISALVNLGACLGKQDRRAEAAEVFDAARRLNPDNPIILNNLAAHVAREGDTAQAESLYRRAMTINPDYMQAHVNLGNLLERAGRYPAALAHLHATCERFPSHAPAVAALALVHVRLQQWDAAAEVGERAVDLDDADATTWTNLGVARYQLGRVQPALAATYRATQLDPSYAPAVKNWEQLATQYPDFAAAVADVKAPRIDVQSGPAITFFHQGLPFTGTTLRERGLGGTESAVVYMAEALARRGCRVTVLNKCAASVEEHGVRYRPVAAAAATLADTPPAALITVRAWGALELAQAPTLRVYWAQDAPDQPAVQGLADPAVRTCIDRYLGISAWQVAGYCAAFGIDPALWTQTRNGVNAALFATPRPDRDRHKLLYTSTPFRGLDVLLDVFPRIRAAVPDATLDLYTSMAVYGVSADADRAEFGALYARAEQPGVRLLGSVPQAELAHALLGAGLLAYPNHFAETSCIAAIEAQAAGCPVVTTALGALPETVVHGETGWCIPGDARTGTYQDAFVQAVVGLLQDDAEWRAFSHAGRTRALDEYAWDHIAEEWLDVIAGACV